MKVSIGKFTTWLGPFQLAEKILFWKDREDRVVHRFGHWLAENKKGEDSWITKVCEWVNSKKKRKVYVHIDKWDTWNMDSTLALIILPVLKQLKATKHGAPHVDDRDVPTHLSSLAAPIKKHDWDTDANHFQRWDWVLDEMIWAFEQLQPDSNWQDQFYSGVYDWKSEPCKWDSEGKPTLYQMVDGPNHTAKLDVEGMDKYQARITAGLELFGKYYQNLWD